MTRVSFRRPTSRVYPPLRSLIPAGACVLAASIALAGCGGGGSSATSGPPQSVSGAGFVFKAPGKWHVTRTQDRVAASPSPVSDELVSVSVFPLLRQYTPDLFDRLVARELDPHAEQLAKQQGGYVRTKQTVTLLGQNARQYVILFGGKKRTLQERITFVFRNKTEFELLCRWEGDKSAPDYCAQLESSFRLI